MRRPLRPFTVETKNARRADKPVASAPAPFLEPEPVAERQRASPHMKAAQALFDKPAPVQPQPGMPEAGARVLRSLIEPPPVVPVFDDLLDEPVRRGRKPGSKNRPREAPLPTARKSSRQSWADFMVQDDEAQSMEAGQPAREPAESFVVVEMIAELPRLVRTGRLSRDQLPRAERWKARLPRFARGAGWIKRVRP